ncbi:hypothetical protein [Actinoplanes missouriensis]|nr:hypothetical protein [Actinoplanes missouriensis]
MPASRHSRTTWWIAALFAAGSTCFLVAPIPAFAQLVGPGVDGLVFFVGSLFFTTAAGLQWWDTKLLSAEPPRLDRWSSGVQFVGTLFFNATTFRALQLGFDSPDYDRLVWRPDAFGSICFLISGYLAYVQVTGHLLSLPRRTLESAIATVNLLGCLAFGASAAASYVIPAAGDELNATVVNSCTALGALCFLIGALLLFPQRAREPRPV